jgi:hypothetical protein
MQATNARPTEANRAAHHPDIHTPRAKQANVAMKDVTPRQDAYRIVCPPLTFSAAPVM